MEEKFGLFDIIIYILMGLVLIAVLYPILHVVAVSFSSASYIVQGKVGVLPKGFSLDAYKHIFKSSQVPRAYGNTILYTTVGTMINILMTAIMAYPLSKSQLIGRTIIMKLIIFTMFFSGGTIPTYLVVKSLKLINTMWSLVLPNAIWTMELLILISFYRTLPISLYESAVLDGASEYRVLFQIFLPLSKASLASIGLFYFMGHWNSYFLPLIYLNDSKKYPLQLILKDMLLDDSSNISSTVANSKITSEAVKNATIFITMIPVLLVYPFAQKYFVKGVMIGSIKG
ncbi:sugar ABC transporter permease [Clostridium thermosuccinogenes]|jgi:putative aldouronate transport system permease protein|uniref:Sugar ABC transporter permease n=1 Tax=Clostridium thermosuccinogenes TaxID=84032 RepID=A0A2K2F9A2_9CLOT|nr:carbohydrate ABC transporter permease [Pseudoclostridium thermosuccinogenes]AUS96785.1 sugar ABC transporter permease [Pseudoclostridium thermosuccinogenes]PNT92551.1 sugar ABC transporter permease [Pseudoclostridium thermosuccinogenes]PNT95355.1 sugar ABC transporter permease [Pseudoclostridium thermosuccinogenes]PNT96369.1 sugar ABC transporter permease [Pseudoclostridium thermosuccinogenes]